MCVCVGVGVGVYRAGGSLNLAYAATRQLTHLVPRVFVEFHRPRPSRTRPVEAVQPVLDAVYVALKRRQSRQPLELYVDMRDRDTHRRRRSERVMVVEDELKPIKLPRTGFHQIIVTEVRYVLTLGRYFHMVCIPRTITPSQLHPHSHTLTVTPSLSYPQSHPHCHILTVTPSQSHPHSYTLTPSLSHPHCHISLSLPHSHTHLIIAVTVTASRRTTVTPSLCCCAKIGIWKPISSNLWRMHFDTPILEVYM